LHFHRGLPSEAALCEIACVLRTVNTPPHQKSIGASCAGN
jgi:hypothetical protein